MDQEDGLVTYKSPAPAKPRGIATCQSVDAAAVSLHCFKKGETMQRPAIPAVALQKALLAPVLHKGPGSVLPAQTNTENVVIEGKPSLDVSQQSSAEPVDSHHLRICPESAHRWTT